MKQTQKASCKSIMACLIQSAFICKIQTNLSKYVPEVHNTLSKAHNVHFLYRNLQKHDCFTSIFHSYFITQTYFKCFFKMWLFWLPTDESQIIGVALICSLALKQLDYLWLRRLLQKGQTAKVAAEVGRVRRMNVGKMWQGAEATERMFKGLKKAAL